MMTMSSHVARHSTSREVVARAHDVPETNVRHARVQLRRRLRRRLGWELLRHPRGHSQKSSNVSRRVSRSRRARARARGQGEVDDSVFVCHDTTRDGRFRRRARTSRASSRASLEDSGRRFRARLPCDALAMTSRGRLGRLRERLSKTRGGVFAIASVLGPIELLTRERAVHFRATPSAPFRIGGETKTRRARLRTLAEDVHVEELDAPTLGERDGGGDVDGGFGFFLVEDVVARDWIGPRVVFPR
jgi:hypothetical protein